MKTINPIIRLLFALLLSTFTINKGNTQILLVENFNYANGVLLTSCGWTAHSASGAQSVDVFFPGLSFTGYPLSNIGGAARLDNTGEDVNKRFTVQSFGTVYVACMIKVTGLSDGYFMHLGGDPIGATYRAKVFTIGTSDPFNLGISVGTNTPVTVAGGTYNVGNTYLLIIKYEIVDGTTNNKVSLFVFPGDVPTTEPGTPSVGPLTDSSQSDINPGSIALRQYSSSQNVLTDGILVCKTWADIVTPIPTTFYLNTGWNIFSSNVMPVSADMKFVFQPLIGSGKLVKIQDENGNALEDYGMFGGWTNNIGDIHLTEGYKIKVNDTCQINIEGKLATLPVEIPLKAGWNIMGYPRNIELDGQKVVQQLIDRKTLVKVQDEKGNSIEDYGMFGGWTNNIGYFKPGEGYKVKVTTDEILTISNLPPVFPYNPTPADSSFGISVTPTLSWECFDLDGDGLTFDVYMGTTSENMAQVSSNQKASNFTPSANLNFGTIYYWRISAKDSKGNSTLGPVWMFKVVNEMGTYTDSRDGKVYKTVKIGVQWWMAENLAWLPAVSPPSAESYTAPYYYVYGYSGTDISAAKATANYATYGVLYNWPAALTACPAGWHLPGDAEWKQLEIALAMTHAQADATGYRGTDQGTQMKTTSGWYNIGNGTNSSGFSALPGGYRYYDGGFYDIGFTGVWWSSTEYSSDFAWSRNLYGSNATVIRGYINEEDGFSVRCVKE